MGHAMHSVRRQEKRRSRGEEEEEEGGGGEEDPGGGGSEGGSSGEKQGRGDGKHVERDSGEGVLSGRVRLKGPLLQTYVLSILIRSIMEVRARSSTAAAGEIAHLSLVKSLYVTSWKLFLSFAMRKQTTGWEFTSDVEANSESDHQNLDFCLFVIPLGQDSL